ncbi:SDR family NAD(P)-dependent oxidoreductase [Microbacterium sp. NFH-22A-Y]|uniref:SDR family NAD(P)-dependent oxidoreductase n=1 Tax=Microbacterium sp. NFH-22A-Y TaxID=2744448 RepID=UPI001F303957|nr:SDR family NAD(P)-dependent oxidoreductase [Microbacterium sp. NFH-22A-Y]
MASVVDSFVDAVAEIGDLVGEPALLGTEPDGFEQDRGARMSANQKSPLISVVTGAAGGLGTAIVRELLARGDRIVATDARPAALASLVEGLRDSFDHIDSRVLTLEADAASPSDWGRVRDAAVAAFGSPTVLVNNAGISPKHNGRKLDGLDIPLDEWNEVLAVNLTGPFLGVQAMAPGMAEAGIGRIVNMASLAARHGGLVAGLHYTATKTGLLGVTRSFARELAPSGITVNAVAPGRINSGMVSMVSEEINAEYAAQIPVGRLGTAEDIARTVAFLSDRDAGFITGAVIDVNGGSHMQ